MTTKKGRTAMETENRESEFWGVGATARFLERSEKTIRELEARGLLRATRLPSGQRVFRFADVEAYRQEREARKAASK